MRSLFLFSLIYLLETTYVISSFDLMTKLYGLIQDAIILPETPAHVFPANLAKVLRTPVL